MKPLALAFFLAAIGAGIAFSSVALSAHYAEKRSREASEQRWSEMKQRANSPQTKALVKSLRAQCAPRTYFLEHHFAREDRCVQAQLGALRLQSQAGTLTLDEINALGHW